MFNKKFAAGIFMTAVVITASAFWLMNHKQEEPVSLPEKKEESPKPVPAVKPLKPQPQTPERAPVIQDTLKTQKADLFNDTDKLMPYSGMANLASLSENVHKTVESLLEDSSQGIYYLMNSGENTIVILDNLSKDEEESKRRHDFRIVEISSEDGNILKDTSYNEEKSSEFTEVWNNDEDEPIKYKMTDKDGKVLSMRKEIVENQTNLREEHIFYDENGRTEMNLSFNYDGADLTRFTYYNAEEPEESVTIVNEYQDGIKTKETVYSSEYKVKNTYVPHYENGRKAELFVYDAEGKEVAKLED